VLDTLGLVLMQNQNSIEAVDSLRKAAQGAPHNPDIQFHLAQALVGAGHKDEARTILHTLISSNEPFKDKGSAQKLLSDIGS
jgi:Flp pilus assembly protein TadD